VKIRKKLIFLLLSSVFAQQHASLAIPLPQPKNIDADISFDEFQRIIGHQANQKPVTPNPKLIKKSSWHKLIKIPYYLHSGCSAIFNPIRWITDSVVSPLLHNTIFYPTRYAINHVRDRYIISDDKLKKLPPEDQGLIQNLSQQTTNLSTWSIGLIASHYTDKLINSFAQNFLNKIISTENLPTFNVNPTKYKEEIAKRVLQRLVPNSNVHHYYNKGALIYTAGKLAFDLANNITGALFISYQFTNHAQIHGKAPILIQSKLKKIMMLLDISQRCADSYLKIVTYLGSNTEASQSVKTFQRRLSRFVKIAKTICPYQDTITGSYEISKMIKPDHHLKKKQYCKTTKFFQDSYKFEGLS